MSDERAAQSPLERFQGLAHQWMREMLDHQGDKRALSALGDEREAELRTIHGELLLVAASRAPQLLSQLEDVLTDITNHLARMNMRWGLTALQIQKLPDLGVQRYQIKSSLDALSRFAPLVTPVKKPTGTRAPAVGKVAAAVC